MMSEILKIVERVKSGESSAREEVEAALRRAKETESSHALLEVFEEEALARADEIDAGAKTGRLVGVPYVAKDNFLTTVGHTTAAAKILENFQSPLDATAIERLNAEGAICIGKANLDSFAHGGSTENSAFGATKNAVDDTRVAGGSSGGSAVVVAQGVVPFALGSDTGGSIRQPASFNGVVGYKPTYGMIPRYGVVAMASSTDVVGPIARSVADVELLCEVLAGQDGRDSTVLPDYFKANDLIEIIDPEKFGDKLDEESPKVKKRTAVRVVLLDDNDRVGLIYARAGNYYKLPGGGVKAGETYEQAIHREVIEETGFETEIIEKIGYTKEYYPKVFLDGYDAMIGFSHFYAARAKKFVGQDLTEEEKSDGFEVVWVDSVADAIELIKNAEIAETKHTQYEVIKMIEQREAVLLEAYQTRSDVVKNTTPSDFAAQKKWYGVSGSWRLQSDELDNDLMEIVDKIIAVDGGIITGGALGVDSVATERIMTKKDWQKHLKVIVPTPIEIYEKHFLKRADEGVITHKQAKDLLDLLKKVKAGGCLTEMDHNALDRKTYYDRNTEVAKACDELLAFQVNGSRGVQDTVDKAIGLGKKVLLNKYYVDDVVKNTTPKKLKIGVIKEFMSDGVDEDVKERTRQFVKKLTAVGHSVGEVSLPMVKYALPIYYIVVPAEISSNLARYDGVRYGARSDTAKTLAEVYGQSRDAGFVDENKRRIMIGSSVLSSGFFDAYYLQAQKARTLLIGEFNKLFDEYDFLIGPVAPTPAYKIGENISDPIKMYLADIMTVPASLAGLPAISLPNGADKNGLPIGLQIIGPMKSDAKLLNFAKRVE
jgi:Asp-tRNA(Asn)/Glu-tRNA(Gln) amidotransferase A subunit family amidase